MLGMPSKSGALLPSILPNIYCSSPSGKGSVCSRWIGPSFAFLFSDNEEIEWQQFLHKVVNRSSRVIFGLSVFKWPSCKPHLKGLCGYPRITIWKLPTRFPLSFSIGFFSGHLAKFPLRKACRWYHCAFIFKKSNIMITGWFRCNIVMLGGDVMFGDSWIVFGYSNVISLL